MKDKRRPYRDGEQKQVSLIQRKVADFRAEIDERYLGEAEKILVDIEIEFAYLVEMMDEFDEDEARGEDD